MSSLPSTTEHQVGSDVVGVAPTKQPQSETRDFHLDTLFNPVWMSGPNVFSFAENGTVVRPEPYAVEPYPGYYRDNQRPTQPESQASGYAGTHGQGNENGQGQRFASMPMPMPMQMPVMTPMPTPDRGAPKPKYKKSVPPRFRGC